MSSDHDSTTKPGVSVPAGDPPGELLVTDLVDGTGNEAVPGSTVHVHYVGVAWSTGSSSTPPGIGVRRWPSRWVPAGSSRGGTTASPA